MLSVPDLIMPKWSVWSFEKVSHVLWRWCIVMLPSIALHTDSQYMLFVFYVNVLKFYVPYSLYPISSLFPMSQTSFTKFLVFYHFSQISKRLYSVPITTTLISIFSFQYLNTRVLGNASPLIKWPVCQYGYTIQIPV